MVEKLKVEPGDTLPDFKVTSVNGDESTLQQEMGEKGLIIFVLRGTWCPFCVHQIVATRARYPHFQHRGINAVFIIPEESFKIDAFRMTVRKSLPFGLHADEDATIADMLVGAVPPSTTRKVGIYLLNPEREIVWRFVGWDDEYPTHQDVIDAVQEYISTSLNQTA
ncbi:MAG: peroxiredoxin family protein [Chloroflexi bacterium]|nr:peroxiredoxin family protein [Chloroflexota bacterium]